MGLPLRGGATLTEVLIALLIMSIGLVSLAVLFPISVLRSIKASQFTTATDSRYNAEAMIDLYPNLIRNPDYHVNALGALDPSSHYSENFIVDPLGFAVVSGPLNSPAVQALAPYFGNDPNLPVPSATPWNPATLVPGQWLPRRYAGTWTTEAAADYLVTMPDSWNLEYQGQVSPGSAITGSNSPNPAWVTQLDVVGLNLGNVSMSATFPTVPAPQIRAVIFSADGFSSHARIITKATYNAASNTTTILWTEDVNNTGGAAATGADINANGVLDYYPLPANFVAGGIGNVRIETQSRRYTWLLTVRMDALGVQPSVDVVVFFQRRFFDDQGNIDEYLYQATFNLGSTVVTVNYPTANPPKMKKGNYIFDANNFYWYRISNVVDNGAGQATIYLDVPANASNTNVPDPINPPNMKPARAMFPRNIVDVYPIGTKGVGQ